MALQLYNTLTRRKEPFETLEPGVVRMYVCGNTVYDSAHIGHLMKSIIFDVIRRYLEYRGYRVVHVENFTDVDDKIINRAAELGVEWTDLIERYIAEYLRQTEAFGILPATAYPRATQEMDQIQAMIAGLIDKGFAYAIGGDVYYRVNRKPDYGKLSNRNIEEMQAGARIEVDDRKEYPMDFALWKGAKAGEPAWSSPWGPGRPGWHIECSAMCWHHLGAQLDIHGGGRDLIFPHHENEIAQSEAFHGAQPFARYWLHNGLLLVDDEKMSKSLGNFITIQNVLDRGEAVPFRYFVVTSHYRKPVNYTRADFEAAARGLARLHGGLRPATEPPTPSPEADTELERARGAAVDAFVTAMDDDFNTPDALAALHNLMRAINRGRDAAASAAAVRTSQATLRELAGVLGVDLDAAGGDRSAADAAPFIQLLIDVRAELRAARQWALADTIRQRLAEQGVQLEDSPTGTTFRVSHE
ncbi:MAG: cysteine--tRNA ligase [Chloroflexi bacterium]|nr:cysteine--tRNA ligase [Chloroflexota bacterium]